MKFPSPNLDPNVLCKQIWDRYGDSWTVHYNSKKNRQLLGTKNIENYFGVRNPKRNVETMNTQKKSSQVTCTAQRKRFRDANTELSDEEAMKHREYGLQTFTPSEEDINIYLFKEDDEVDEFNEAKKLLYIRIHPKHPKHFVLSPQANKNRIWTMDLGDTDPNNLIRQMVILYKPWEKLFYLLDSPRQDLISYEGFLQSGFGRQKKNWKLKKDNQTLLLRQIHFGESQPSSFEYDNGNQTPTTSESPDQSKEQTLHNICGLYTQPLSQTTQISNSTSDDVTYDQSIPSESSIHSSLLSRTLLAQRPMSSCTCNDINYDKSIPS
ncbi:hypothetical protein LEN26_008348 [Aphanomyces euteiches]|nr:hypothetical protein AeMF1_005555 [Aphanomyces euteiches]KAH9130623.1 hypothetical protein LEN26_008348 [Aphanomyces euteiches]KAH9182769.1 hypothetical protein AeNC1_015255 [Aphanomyces euteiches]